MSGNYPTVRALRALAEHLRAECAARGAHGFSVRLDADAVAGLLQDAADGLEGAADLVRHRARPRSRDVDVEYWRRWLVRHVPA